MSAFRIGLFTFFGCCFVCVGTILCVKNLGIFSREREAEENLSLHCIPQFFVLLREGTRLLYREVPGGVAHCWRDDDFGMNHCFECGFCLCE